MVNFIKKLKDTENVTVKNIRCNNASKNIAFQSCAEQECLGLQFEYMTCKTPQQNNEQFKHKYATLFGHACAMMNDAGFVDKNVHL